MEHTRFIRLSVVRESCRICSVLAELYCRLHFPFLIFWWFLFLFVVSCGIVFTTPVFLMCRSRVAKAICNLFRLSRSGISLAFFLVLIYWFFHERLNYFYSGISNFDCVYASIIDFDCFTPVFLISIVFISDSLNSLGLIRRAVGSCTDCFCRKFRLTCFA
jgi:hypothetical protein